MFIRAVRPRTFDHFCDPIAVALWIFTPTEMPKFRSALRVSSFYSVMKNASSIRLSVWCIRPGDR